MPIRADVEQVRCTDCGLVMAVWLTSFLLHHGPAFSGLAEQPFVVQQHVVPSCGALECMPHAETRGAPLLHAIITCARRRAPELDGSFVVI